MRKQFTLLQRILGLCAAAVLTGPALLHADPVISEFLATNLNGAEDEDGNHSDWIEIYNPDATPVNLAGWHLTDNVTRLDKWTFPAVTLAPKSFLVVWASNKDRNVGQLHTNFKLDAAGEYLALTRPDLSVAYDFGTAFPPQAPDVAYGVPIVQTTSNLVAQGSAGKATVPTDGSLGTTWTAPSFSDASWTPITTGIGYDESAAPVAQSGLWADSVAEFSGTQGKNNWTYGLYERDADTNGVYDLADFRTTYATVPSDGGITRNWVWNGSVWAVSPGNAPWTQMSSGGGHPGGVGNTGGFQAPIRRWVSEFSGIARITGLMQHPGGCGDGVTFQIFVDGIEVYTKILSASSLEYTVNIPVQAGQAVDFYTDAGPSGTDGCDSFTYTARITGDALADSVADWTDLGTQGARGWSHGHWNKTTDANGVYAASEFAAFPRTTGNTVSATNAWNGTKWVTAAAPLSEITKTGGKPQTAGGTDWAIRRWTSTYSGLVRLTGQVGNAGGGDGVTGRLLIGGTEVFARNVSGFTDGYTVLANVNVGTVVDVILDPNANDTGDADSIFTVNIAAAAAGTTIKADSIADWGAGAQNTNGWSYGFYNKTTDANGVYNDGDFNNTDPAWVAGWSMNPGNPPWTSVSQRFAHPNGTNSGGVEQWVLKRWTSNVAGTVSVDWHVSKSNPNGGGVSFKVFHNGVEKAGAALNGGDRYGAAQTTTVAGLQIGDHIDFALTPVGAGGGTDDGADGSSFDARILCTPLATNLVQTKLADSDADWSASGVQGYKGWTNGLYDLTSDPDHAYAAGDFAAFPHDPVPFGAGNYWTGSIWDIPNGNPPWTEIGQTGAHPNGTNNVNEHWCGRRWEVSTAGNLVIESHVHKTNPNGGGVTLKVFHNGVEKDSVAINGSDTAGVTRSVGVTGALVGDFIDVFLTPVGPGGTDDGSDGSAFSAKVYLLEKFSDSISATGNLKSVMKDINASAYLRVPFDAASAFDSIALSMKYDDGFVAYLNGTEIARRNAPVAQTGGALANSVTEFSGVQGQANWFYGYYDQGLDAAGNAKYDAADFNSGNPNWTFAGGAWSMGPGDPPWTTLNSTGGHPNGANNAATGIHWAMRRYVCESAGTVLAHVVHNKAAAGPGTTARLFHNGVEKYTSVASNPTGTQALVVLENVQVGDFLDLALDAAVPGDPNDGSDSSTLTVWYGQVSSPGLAWNSAATTSRATAQVTVPEIIDLNAFKSLITPTGNVLAIHGLNSAKSDLDFLISPTITTTTTTIDTGTRLYLPAPTPGGQNGPGSTTIGPVITDHTRLPAAAVADADDLVITAKVWKTVDNISSVRLRYRTNFGPETEIAMTRIAGTNANGEGTYSATIPAAAAAPGEMLRWKITAEDSNGDTMKYPPFADPLNAPEYEGVVIANPAVTSTLPILYTFMSNPGAAASGTRLSISYNGTFLDNVAIDIHGQSSQGFPKKSYDIHLNTGSKLEWKAGEPKINSFNLLTTYPDKANMRNMLAMETFRDAGAAHHFAFPVQVRVNGAFHSVAHFVEDGDGDYLQRLGYTDQGALYKMYNTMNGATPPGAEKKNRQWEGFQDLQTLVNNVAAGGAPRATYLYDNAGVPETVNYLAAMFITGNTDCCHKNYYMFRDSEGNGEWYPTPWDVDLSFGRVWLPSTSYFEDPMHPETPLYIGNGNSFMTSFLDGTSPALKQMYLRRVRTLVDTMLQPAATPLASRYLENKIDAYDALMANDAAIDATLWPTWGTPQTQAQAVAIMKTYLNDRRTFVYGLADLPAAQSPTAVVNFGTIEYLPASHNQDEEFFTLTNPSGVAIDVSGWTIEGAVTHTLKPGTVIAAGGTLHLSPNVVAFRARTASPKAGQNAFVQGDYHGHLSAMGETLTLKDGARVVATTTYAGTPTPAQQYLRITEMDYHPCTRAGDTFADKDQYEFIEFVNTGTAPIDVTGVHFSNGIVLTAPAAMLPPGVHVVAVKNVTAFLQRNPGFDTQLIVGTYTGSLDNSGERVTMLDSVNEEILDFTYDPLWYPLTDGQGFSLTVASETQTTDLWTVPAGWKPSGRLCGTPGAADFAGDTDSDGMPDLWEVVNGLNPLSAADAALDADNDGQTNLQEYAAGTDPNSAVSLFALTSGTWSPSGEFRGTFDAIAGKTYTVQVSTTLLAPDWTNLMNHTATTSGVVPFTDPGAIGAQRRYYRVVTPQVP